MSDQISKSNTIGILAIVFAVLGIFFLGIVFVPLAALLSIVVTYQAIKGSSSLIIAIVAWVLTIIALITSLLLLAALGVCILG